MDIEELVKAHKKEKDRYVADRMLLILDIERGGKYITEAARSLNRVRSWGVVAAIAIRSLFAKITQSGVLCHAKAP